jgi:hypothetical protein
MWAPVGSTAMERSEVRFVFGQLMSGPEGIAEARRLDGNVIVAGRYIPERATNQTPAHAATSCPNQCPAV